ncbi:MAG: hypothetical protein Q4Q06_01220 [Bacteroidota bacterium]|nr:hypothetical protein [Bacteroidota bacterium]
MFFCLTTGVFAQNVVHNLKDNPIDIKNFDKRNYSQSKDAIYFLADDNSQSTGRLIINLSTKEQDNITLSWQNTTANKVRTQWSARLQYRLSQTEEWQDVLDKGGKAVVFYSQYKRYRQNFSDIKLPSSCENQEFVQISWLIGTKGKKTPNPQILFRNILIKSEYDKFFGTPAEVKVFSKSGELAQQVENIIFNNVGYPYLFPEQKRIFIEGKNIRDSITFEITGKNSYHFSLSEYSLKSNRFLFVSYTPKSEGKHEAVLEINTSKLKGGVIRIPLKGSCSKHRDYDKNYIPVASEPNNTFSYHIPVFSNTDYQFSFQREEHSVSKIFVEYKWKRNNKVLSIMADTLKNNNYCVPLQSPKTADEIEIALSSEQEFLPMNAYFGYPKVKTMIQSGLWSDDNNWKDKNSPVMEDFVMIANGIQAIVDEDASCSMLFLGDSANVVIENGKIFYVASDIFYNQKSFFTVNQNLLPKRWNYISSPINQAHAAIFSMKNDSNDSWLMQYNTGIRSKHNDYWSEYITDPKFVLDPGKGYAIYTHEPLVVKYEGLLCASNVSVNLKSTPDDKWNMIGNPYTAPLSSKKLFEELDGKIQGNTIMLFDRENEVYNPIIIDPKEEIAIPSLESFFVEAYTHSTNILFKRSQQYIPLTGEKVLSNHNYLNLSVCKGKNYQYALLGMIDEAKFDFDEYDCHKLFGTNEDMPEIYFKDENDEYSVNVFPSYPASFDVDLYIGNPHAVELNLNNLAVLPENIVVFMEDKESGEFYNLCENASIKTSINSGVTQRYRIHIIKAMDNAEYKDIYIWTDGERCLIYSADNHLNKIRIKNSLGKVESERSLMEREVFQYTLPIGRYKIDLNISDNWINNCDLEVK